MGDTPKWYEFRGEIQPISRSLCVMVPAEITAGIGRIGQMKVRICVNGIETSTLMLQGAGGRHYVKLSAGYRKLANIDLEKGVTMRLAVSEADPPFDPPDDLREALAAEPLALARWEMMPFRLKRGLADHIDMPGRPEIRARRIRKVIESLVL